MRSHFGIAHLLVLFVPPAVLGQATYTWNHTTSARFDLASNWSPATRPGSSSSTDNADIAQWGSAGTNPITEFNFSTLGSQYYLGSIRVNATHTVNRTLGSNSGTAGILQLNGNEANRLILSNDSSSMLTIAPQASSGGIGPLTLRLRAPTSTIEVSGTGGITISAVISQNGLNRGIDKIGSGTLTLSGANSYTGNTTISAGTLTIGVSGAISNSSTVIVGSGARLDVSEVSGGFVLGNSTSQSLRGLGTVTGGLTVGGNGFLRADSGSSTGTLNVSNVTVHSGGTLFANLGASGTNSTLAVAGNTLDLKTGSVLKLDDVTGYGYGTFNLATFTNGNTLQLDAIGNRPDGFVFGTYQQGVGASGPVTIDVSSLPTLNAGDKLTLQRNGNNLSLTFTPVPEPSSVLGVCALLIGGVVGLRKIRRAKGLRHHTRSVMASACSQQSLMATPW